MKRKVCLAVLLLLLLPQLVSCFAIRDVDFPADESSAEAKRESQAESVPEEQSAEPSADELSAAEPSAEEPSAETEPYSMTFSFVGDCMLGTYLGGVTEGSFNEAVQTHGYAYFLENVRDVFLADDLTVANCEVVLTDRDLPYRDKFQNPQYWFKSGAQTAQVFSLGGVDAVSIANNHTHDYGDDGYDDTAESLRAAGVEPFGDTQVKIFEKNGFTVAFLFVTLYWEGDIEKVESLVRTYADTTDFQIVYYHGGTEKVFTSDAWRTAASKRLIDAGADSIIASHPHYIQQLESYKGVTIVPSLGNFCYGSLVDDNSKNTMIYQLTLQVENGKLISTEDNIIPCYAKTGTKNDYHPYILPDGEIRDKILDFLAGNRSKPY